LEDKIIELLREFAVQLGTTVDKILVVMTKQAIVSTYSYFIGYFTILIAFFVWLYCTHRAKKLGIEMKRKYEDREVRDGRVVYCEKLRAVNMWEVMFDDDNNSHIGTAVAWVISLVWWGVGVIVFIATVGDVITRLSNPQYWAITKLMGIVF